MQDRERDGGDLKSARSLYGADWAVHDPCKLWWHAIKMMMVFLIKLWTLCIPPGQLTVSCKAAVITGCHKLTVLCSMLCLCVIVVSAGSRRLRVRIKCPRFQCRFAFCMRIKGSRLRRCYSAGKGVTKLSKVLNLSQEMDFGMSRVTEEDFMVLKCNFPFNIHHASSCVFC